MTRKIQGTKRAPSVVVLEEWYDKNVEMACRLVYVEAGDALVVEVSDDPDFGWIPSILPDERLQEMPV